MRTLFATLLAIAVVLWGGYAGQHWLPKPQEPAISQRPAGRSISKTTDGAEKFDLPSRTEETQAEHGTEVKGKAEASEGVARLVSSNKAASGMPPKKDDPQVSIKAEDIAPGSCMPIGITVSGKVVFPMQCQELLARNGASGDLDGSSSLTNSNSPALAPKEDQKAEAPKSLAEGSVTQKPTEPSDAYAKLEDRPRAGGVKFGKGRAEPDVEPGRRVEKRANFQNSNSDFTMIIVRTIFPRWSR
jgi:hypothetical protein